MISVYYPSHEWDKTNDLLKKPLHYIDSSGTLLIESESVDVINQVIVIDTNQSDQKNIHYKSFVFESEGVV